MVEVEKVLARMERNWRCTSLFVSLLRLSRKLRILGELLEVVATTILIYNGFRWMPTYPRRLTFPSQP